MDGGGGGEGGFCLDLSDVVLLLLLLRKSWRWGESVGKREGSSGGRDGGG